MPGLEGLQLGSCALLRRIGGGGMGEVYLAEQRTLGRQVAVKVIQGSGNLLARADVQARATSQFVREARAVAALEHPNILPLYEYGEQRGIHYLVMPYLSDGSLADVLAPEAAHRLPWPLPQTLACEIITQAAAALQFAHDHGVIHRDVKPQNLLVRRLTSTQTAPQPALSASGALARPVWAAPTDTTAHTAQTLHILLADFGLARFLTELTGSSTGATGTPLYTAPEQYMGHPEPATDQYALACVAYFLLVGRPVFVGTIAELHHQHLTIAPAPATQLNPTLPPAVDPVFWRALAKEPADRFPQVAMFAEALRQALQPALYAASAPWGTQTGRENLATFPSAPGMAPTGTSPFPAAADASGLAAFTPGTLSATTTRPSAPPPAMLPARGQADVAGSATTVKEYKEYADAPAAALPLQVRRLRFGGLGKALSRVGAARPADVFAHLKTHRRAALVALVAILVLASLGVAYAGGALLLNRNTHQHIAHAPRPTATATRTPAPTATPAVAHVPIVTGAQATLDAVVQEGSHLVDYWRDANHDWLVGATFGDGIQSAPSTAYNSGNGDLDVVVRRNGVLAHYWRDAQGHWNGPEVFGDAETSAPSLAYNANGNLDVAVREGSQIAYYYRNASSGAWVGPVALFGSAITGDVSLAFDSANGDQLVAAMHGGQLVYYYRNASTGAWSGGEAFGDTGVTYGGVSIAYNGGTVLSGFLEVVATENNQLVYYYRDASAWHRVSVYGNGIATGPTILVNPSSGNLEIVAGGYDLVQHFYISKNATWNGPDHEFSDGGTIKTNPSLAFH